MRRGSTLFTLAGIATLSAMPALAQSAPAGTTVHFATCTLPGVESGCIVASSGGAGYNVTGLKPGIRPYQWLQGTATVTNKMSHCMQGPVVDNWVPDKNQSLVGCVERKPIVKRRRPGA